MSESAPAFLPEGEVNAQKLAEIFKVAYMKCTIDEDGDLLVQTDGPRVFVSVQEDKKLLKFIAMYGLKESATEEMKMAFVNRMNDGIIFARFSVARADTLMADYYLPYEEGILAFQIVAALRLFGRVVPGAIQACDKDDLVP